MATKYLERVRKLLPAFRERAALTERDAAPARRELADFQRAGLAARPTGPRDGAAFELHPAAFFFAR